MTPDEFKFDNLSSLEQEAVQASSKQRGVFVPAALVERLKGDIGAAAILAQFFWWACETSDPEGWFYKTGAKLKKEIGMGRGAQDRALKRLMFWQLLEKDVRGVPAKRYFRINLTRYLGLISGKTTLPTRKQASLPTRGQTVMTPREPQIERVIEKENTNTDDSDSLPEQDPAIKVPVTGTIDPRKGEPISEEDRTFLDALTSQSEVRNAGMPARESKHWSERQKDSPWLAWHPGKVRARAGVSAEALQKIGWLIERRTSLVPVDRQWSGWLKALLMIYQVAQGDMRVVETGVKATWAREDRWKPAHAQGFVKEVQKARALKTKRESERTPMVGEVYQ